ncbi:sensor histidine kinase [Streptomyces sp. LNU-CPARS28]|uniref:sensor histidine kinase n=1 Tax=Streptomyces sp. LNU-CPARS28 TaxID=3137371 RepID=UPI004054BBA9
MERHTDGLGAAEQHPEGLSAPDQGKNGLRGARQDEGETHAMGQQTAGLHPAAPESRWLAPVMHTAFFLLLAASLTRFLLRHPGEPRTPGVVALSIALAVLYLLGPAPGAAPSTRRPFWLGSVVGAWVVLVVLAPSFAWCAVPLFYTGLRTLPTRAALVLVTALTALVVAAQLRLAGSFDPNLAFAPPAVAAVATAMFIHMQRQTAQQRALIDDLIRTRRELAATERREGTLAERQRLSMEIHDTLAQGMSSQQMLLQAAERVWDADPATARTHVRTAAAITERGLAEARRFVHDLAPADLADAGTDDGEALPSALSTLAARESEGELAIQFHAEGKPVSLPGRAQSALLRIAQGALANVREHADASAAALTLTYLDDQVVLDIADNGKGFVVAGDDTGFADGQDERASEVGDTAREGAATGDQRGPGPRGPGARAGRGHGLPAIRARARQLGGTLTVESAPGEGTVLSVSIPLTAPSASGTRPSAGTGTGISTGAGTGTGVGTGAGTPAAPPSPTPGASRSAPSTPSPSATPSEPPAPPSPPPSTGPPPAWPPPSDPSSSGSAHEQ